jgi:hypothetical protein
MNSMVIFPLVMLIYQRVVSDPNFSPSPWNSKIGPSPSLNMPPGSPGRWNDGEAAHRWNDFVTNCANVRGHDFSNGSSHFRVASDPETVWIDHVCILPCPKWWSSIVFNVLSHTQKKRQWVSSPGGNPARIPVVHGRHVLTITKWSNMGYLWLTKQV